MSLDTLLTIPEAAAKYSINEKRLRGAVWQNRLTDPIGDLATDQVYDDWRLQKMGNRHEQATVDGSSASA